MTIQKIFGLVVSEKNTPITEKPLNKDQCFICGFTFSDENCIIIFTDKDLKEKRKVHSKCIENHLKLIPKNSKIAVVNNKTNQVQSYTST